MRFIIMHTTNAHWEAGERPSKELIARVGALMGELATAGALHGGDGLRASSEGVRLKFSGETRTVTPGPFEANNELAAAFSVIRAASMDEAIEWATRQAEVLRPLDDVEIDIRPVTEPWDIGLAPPPANLTTRRYMCLRKATAATETGAAPWPEQRAALARLIEETTRSGIHLTTESLRPSRRGRRYKNAVNGISVYDGPFLESKELLAGFVIVSADSLDDAGGWAERYIAAVGADEVDVRELE